MKQAGVYLALIVVFIIVINPSSSGGIILLFGAIAGLWYFVNQTVKRDEQREGDGGYNWQYAHRGRAPIDSNADRYDDSIKTAIAVVSKATYASPLLLQEKMFIEYARACTILEQMEELGVVGPEDSIRHRDVLLTPEEVTNLLSEWVKDDKLEEDHKEHVTDEELERELQDIVQELQQVPGSAAAKRHVQQMAELIMLQEQRENEGQPIHSFGKHMVFTGEYTEDMRKVVELTAQMLTNLQVLSEGIVTEAVSEDFIDPLRYETEEKTEALLDEAHGGVLVIHNPYQLLEGEHADQGQEAIFVLLSLLDDYSDDLVVILTGSADRMRDFIDQNIHVRAYFPHVIPFASQPVQPMQPQPVRQEMKTAVGATAAASQPLRMDVQPPHPKPIVEEAIMHSSDTIMHSDAGSESSPTESFDLEAKLLQIPMPEHQKEQIREWSKQLEVYQKRKSQGMYAESVPMCVLVKEGDSRTRMSVSVLLGELYQRYGVLSRGHVVQNVPQDYESSSSSSLSGTTPLQAKFAQAQGGVLLFDLHDFGAGNGGGISEREAAQLIVRATDRSDSGVLIVAAGTEANINAFFQYSSVLRMRFAKHITLD
ncbi:DNA translocase FtsK [Paenibacillus marinisediminis]